MTRDNACNASAKALYCSAHIRAADTLTLNVGAAFLPSGAEGSSSTPPTSSDTRLNCAASYAAAGFVSFPCSIGI